LVGKDFEKVRGRVLSCHGCWLPVGNDPMMIRKNRRSVNEYKEVLLDLKGFIHWISFRNRKLSVNGRL